MPMGTCCCCYPRHGGTLQLPSSPSQEQRCLRLGLGPGGCWLWEAGSSPGTGVCTQALPCWLPALAPEWGCTWGEEAWLAAPTAQEHEQGAAGWVGAPSIALGRDGHHPSLEQTPVAWGCRGAGRAASLSSSSSCPSLLPRLYGARGCRAVATTLYPLSHPPSLEVRVHSSTAGGGGTASVSPSPAILRGCGPPQTAGLGP